MDIRSNDWSTVPGLESRHSCSSCPMGDYCLPYGLRPADACQLDGLMRVSRTLYPKQYLFHAGEPLTAIYAVRHGAFKTAVVDCEGHEQVVGFHVHTELFGLDGIFSGVHQCSAIALSAANVCIFPYRALLELASDIGALGSQLLRLFSKDIVANIASAGDYLADERLAAFLLALAQRVPPRGELSLHFTLPMSRADIASYLRVAGETLSRTLARIQRRDLVRIDQRSVDIVDLPGLRRLARRVPPPQL